MRPSLGLIADASYTGKIDGEYADDKRFGNESTIPIRRRQTLRPSLGLFAEASYTGRSTANTPTTIASARISTIRLEATTLRPSLGLIAKASCPGRIDGDNVPHRCTGTERMRVMLEYADYKSLGSESTIRFEGDEHALRTGNERMRIMLEYADDKRFVSESTIRFEGNK